MRDVRPIYIDFCGNTRVSNIHSYRLDLAAGAAEFSAVFCQPKVFGYANIAYIPLGSSRRDTTLHIRRVEPMHFGCVELVEQHGSTHST